MKLFIIFAFLSVTGYSQSITLELRPVITMELRDSVNQPSDIVSSPFADNKAINEDYYIIKEDEVITLIPKL